MTQQSWGILRQHRYLLRFPLVGCAVSLIPIVLAAAAGGGATVAQDDGNDLLAWVLGILALLCIFVIVLVGNVVTGGLVTAVTSELRGQPSSLGAGLRAARGRLGVLARWSLVQMLVSAILSRVRGNGRGSPVAGLLRGLVAASAGIVWSLVTSLVMPVLMNEDVKMVDAVKRSAHLLKGCWGDQLRGRVRIGGLLIIALILPALAGIIGGLAMMAAGGVLTAIGVPVMLLSLLVFGFALLLAQAIRGVFSTVLYLYAVHGQAPAGFSEVQLAGAVTA